MDTTASTANTLCCSFVFLLLFNLSCLERFDEDNLIEQTADLCADVHEFSRAIFACQEMRNQDPNECSGVASFRGSIRSSELAVTDEVLSQVTLNKIIFKNETGDIGPFFDALEYIALGNYALYRFSFEDIGILEEDDAGVSYLYPGGKVEGLESTQDYITRVSLRITTGNEDFEIAAVPGIGLITLTHVSEILVRGQYRVAYENASDTISGCFELYPSEIETETWWL